MADREAVVDAEGGEELYTVSIKGNGVVVEKSVPAEVARRVINALMAGAFSEGASMSGSAATQRARQALRHAGSRCENFLKNRSARRNPDKIITIAEFVRQFEDKELFTREDIRGRFRLAGEAAPANFPRDFTWAVKNGWIAEDAKSPNSFYVTQTGRNAIANRFSSEVKKGTPQPTARRRPRKAKLMRNSEG